MLPLGRDGVICIIVMFRHTGLIMHWTFIEQWAVNIHGDSAIDTLVTLSVSAMWLIIFLPSCFSVPFILLPYLRLWLALLVMFLFTDSNPRLTVLVSFREFWRQWLLLMSITIFFNFWLIDLRHTCRPESTLKWGGICKVNFPAALAYIQRAVAAADSSSSETSVV